MLDPVSFEPLLTATLIAACGHTFNADTIESLPTNLCPLCKTAFDRATGTQPNFALRTVVEAFQRKAAKAPAAVTSAAPAPASAAAPAVTSAAPAPVVSVVPPHDSDNESRFIDLTGDDLRKHTGFMERCRRPTPIGFSPTRRSARFWCAVQAGHSALSCRGCKRKRRRQ